jgi:hypothetical protein
MNQELFNRLDVVMQGIVHTLETETMDFPTRSQELAKIAEIIQLFNQLTSRNLLDYHDIFMSFTPTFIATPLIMAIYRNDVDLIHVCLDCGANPNLSSHVRDNTRGYTPLDVAVHIGHPDVLEWLLDAGATHMNASVTTPPDEVTRWNQIRDMITDRIDYVPNGPGYHDAREDFDQLSHHILSTQ